MSNRILVVTAQGEVRYLGSESEAVRVLTIQPTGARGAAGATGAGVAAGGAANDILKKTSATDYATEWETPTSAATADTIVRRDETGGAFFGGDVGAPKYRGGAYQAESATDGASLRNSSGTAILTWGATAGNISITVNTTSTGHFFSNPSTSEAGHFITKNGTTPTLAAGRSAWFSNASGVPQFKNGTGSAVTLLYDGGALGTPLTGTLTNCTGLPVSTGISGFGANVATFLATPSSANLIAAVTDATGDGDIVTNANPTIYDIYLQESVNFNAESYTYGAGSAALHRAALELTALATTTPGTGVATALAVNVGTAGAFVVNGGALGTPTSGTLTSCTGLPISTGVSGLGTNVAAFLATPTSANLAAALTDETGTGAAVFATSPTITTPTISRGSVGQVFTAQDNNGCVTTMTTDSFGRNFLQINGKSGASSQAGAYITASGFEEAWAYVNCLNNTSGQRVMRFGNKTNRFSIQRLNDANTSITATPFSFANDAPENSFYMLTSGTIGCGTATPSEKSLLDLTSTTKGFLPPRMTTVQRDAITSVPAGLMIYNTTTNKLNVYTTAWEAVTSV